MVSLRITSSFDSSSALSSPTSFVTVPPSPAVPLDQPSPSSSNDSLNLEDENATITIKPKAVELGDLQLLAISTHMTELSYAISDIQARTFEIQELRHKPHSAGDSANTSTIIDQSLAAMDEKLDSVAKGIKSINDTLEPLLRNSTTPTLSSTAFTETNERAAVLRKHAALLGEWEAVQKESQVLREELKEDKWLTVFRTVTDQADGMMSSLEKAVNRCQDFIFQFHRKGPEIPLSMSQTSLSSSSRSDKPNITFEVFNSLQESYEAKKKHYMPATSKVLSIIDKGVQERVTKNGETLRRHAESAHRWRNLRERITRTDAEMENVRRLFLTGDASSEADSSVSSKNGYLATPPSGHRMSRTSSAGLISGSMSPLRMLRKLTNSGRTSTTPLSVNKNKASRTPSSEPPPNSKKNHKISLHSSTRASDTGAPVTPERPVHRHSQSLTPQSSPRTLIKPEASSTEKSKGPQRPTWNSSTKVEPEEKSRTMKGTPHSRAPSASGNYPDYPTTRRSFSRASMSSSRPWSPITSSSTAPSHLYAPPPLPTFWPPSRPQTPSQKHAPTTANTPRPRPKTPSHIPIPKSLRSVSTSVVEGLPADYDAILSPTFSASGMSDASAPGHPPRPPSRSRIPIPSLQFSTPSRPSTSMSKYGTPESPTSRMSFKSQLARAQTPEIVSLGSLRAKPLQASVSGSSSGKRSTSRPPIPRLPPSSFRDGQSSRAPSRPSSRAGAQTPVSAPSIESWLQAGVPTHEYIPVNWKDPLDVEVAKVLNSLAHGFKVERLDPPLRKVKEGEDIQAKYSFSTTLGSKNLVLKLTSVNRRGEGVKKVMCRVGGGWQDLTDYVLNRQM